jgi:predicted acylesterase/phospholipase RssA
MNFSCPSVQDDLDTASVSKDVLGVRRGVSMTVGLVLGAGGAKGSFEVGALGRLYEEGFFAPVIAASSAGSIGRVWL